MRSKTFYKPLAAAFKASGMTLDQLLKRSGLDITKPSLWRKLHGEQGIVIESGEAEKLGMALGLTVALTSRGARYEKAA